MTRYMKLACLSLPCALVLLTTWASGCGTTATIETRSYTYEGEIIGRDPRSVIIVDERGKRVAVDRDDIKDIDHPGNVAATIGVILVAYGLVNIAVGASKCSSKEAAWCFGVYSPAAIGLGMSIYGFATYGESVWALDKQADPRPHLSRLRLTPVPLVGQGSVGPGLSLSGAF